MTQRDWKIRGTICTSVQRGDRVLAIMVEPESLVVTTIEGPAPAPSGSNEAKISAILRDHSNRVLGTGKDLLDAMRIASEYMDQWEAGLQ
jgi:hypothetical protein